MPIPMWAAIIVSMAMSYMVSRIIVGIAEPAGSDFDAVVDGTCCHLVSGNADGELEPKKIASIWTSERRFWQICG